jgi:exosome complex exonuclease RRP6
MKSPLREKAQDGFADRPDNANAPWAHRLEALGGVVDVAAARAAAAAAAAAGAPRPHPLAARLAALRYPPAQLALPPPPPPLAPSSFDDTPFEFVDALPALRAAAARLAAASEIAVDLEAHMYRSFQGFVCLIQLSTRSEDIIIDALKLRAHVGPALAPVFADPRIVKVLHGADGDVTWLQRDFGVFLVNMFDTGQAARVLGHAGHGLGALLERAAGFAADKRWQLADWRLRPLAEQALHYARADTHFLLRCYDALRRELAAAAAGPDGLAGIAPGLRVALPPGGPGGPLGLVLERSRHLCLLQYEREQHAPDSFAAVLDRLGSPLAADAGVAAFAALHAWRDGVARAEDESTGFVLPRAALLRLARELPVTAGDVARCAGRGAPVAARRAAEVAAVIRGAVADPAPAVELRRAWVRAAQPAPGAPAGAPAAELPVDDAAPAAEEEDAVEPAAAPAPAPAAPAPAPAPTPAPAPASAPAPAPAPAPLQPRTVKPLALGGGALGGGALKPRALKPRALKPLGGAAAALAGAGSALSAALAAPPPAAAGAAVRSLRAELALLPFRAFAPEATPAAAAPAAAAAAAAEPAADAAAAPAEEEEDADTAAERRRAEVRGAMDALRGGGGAAAPEEEEGAGAARAAEFVPLSLTEQYGLKRGRRQRAAAGPASGLAEARVKRKLVELGLEDAEEGGADGAEGGAAEAAAAEGAAAAEAPLDTAAARRKYSFGMTNPHARGGGRFGRGERGRGRGRGGERGRGGRGGERGRGRGAGRGGGRDGGRDGGSAFGRGDRDGGGRGGRGGGRGGRGGGRGGAQEDGGGYKGARVFNPYGDVDVSAFGGARARSAADVRSGNRSKSFRR